MISASWLASHCGCESPKSNGGGKVTKGVGPEWHLKRVIMNVNVSVLERVKRGRERVKRGRERVKRGRERVMNVSVLNGA